MKAISKSMAFDRGGYRRWTGMGSDPGHEGEVMRMQRFSGVFAVMAWGEERRGIRAQFAVSAVLAVEFF
jgi:hypothetical protein